MDDSGFESLLPSIGITLASAIVLLLAFSIFRTTFDPDRQIALQSAASSIAGDIGTVSSSTIPLRVEKSYDFSGINASISGDYVITSDLSGSEFARPIPVAVCPGRYSDGTNLSWNNTNSIRSLITGICGKDGSKDQPADESNATMLHTVLMQSRIQMALQPLEIDTSKPLIIEKMFVYYTNSTLNSTECDPYVLVYQ